MCVRREWRERDRVSRRREWLCGIMHNKIKNKYGFRGVVGKVEVKHTLKQAKAVKVHTLFTTGTSHGHLTYRAGRLRFGISTPSGLFFTSRLEQVHGHFKA